MKPVYNIRNKISVKKKLNFYFISLWYTGIKEKRKRKKAKEKSEGNRKGGRAMKLLVVEDERMLCDTIAKSLHHAGYEVGLLL